MRRPVFTTKHCSGIVKTLLILSVLCSGRGRAAGQSFNGTVTVSATVQTVMALSVTNNSSTSVTMSGDAQLRGGYTVQSFNTVGIKSNVPWNLAVSSATTYFSNSGTYSSSNMPASVIQLNITGQTAKVALSTNAATLSTGGPGNASQPGNTFNLDINFSPGYNYGPGIYTLSTIYTLSSQ